jgi:hypothetical protein
LPAEPDCGAISAVHARMPVVKTVVEIFLIISFFSLFDGESET